MVYPLDAAGPGTPMARSSSRSLAFADVARSEYEEAQIMAAFQVRRTSLRFACLPFREVLMERQAVLCTVDMTCGCWWRLVCDMP